MSLCDELRTHLRTVYAPDVPLEQITDDLDVLHNGVIDSLGVLRLMAWLDQRYDIALSNADVTLDDFRTISSMTALIEREKSAGRHS
ncbi:acyl carrier protein [Streptomyces sp. NPDC048254]|uniref:acyl carrier protein n=1 Tax=Streptomyces sp. NPDC048254 TaxID=3365525 RepID=UPI00371ACB70